MLDKINTCIKPVFIRQMSIWTHFGRLNAEVEKFSYQISFSKPITPIHFSNSKIAMNMMNMTLKKDEYADLQELNYRTGIHDCSINIAHTYFTFFLILYNIKIGRSFIKE